jgi:hypothetical protein
MGVNTPSAAAVAAATVGFARDVHAPKGATFTMGAQSVIAAAGAGAMTPLIGSTVRMDGARPKLHIVLAPAVT